MKKSNYNFPRIPLIPRISWNRPGPQHRGIISNQNKEYIVININIYNINTHLIRSRIINDYRQTATLTKQVKIFQKLSDEKFCNLHQYVHLNIKEEIIKLKAEKSGVSSQHYAAQLFNGIDVLPRLD